jgi:hypothetical protein
MFDWLEVFNGYNVDMEHNKVVSPEASQDTDSIEVEEETEGAGPMPGHSPVESLTQAEDVGRSVRP